MAEYSGSGSSSNAADISGDISTTDNSTGDLLSFLTQANSPGANASLTPQKINWALLAIGAGALALAAWLHWRKR